MGAGDFEVVTGHRYGEVVGGAVGVERGGCGPDFEAVGEEVGGAGKGGEVGGADGDGLGDASQVDEWTVG